MIKNKKKKTSYLSDNKTFATFGNMKTYAYFNTRIGETKEGYEMYRDEIIKHYLFNRKERRLLCEKIYDKEVEHEKWCNSLQLNLFENEKN